MDVSTETSQPQLDEDKVLEGRTPRPQVVEKNCPLWVFLECLQKQIEMVRNKLPKPMSARTSLVVKTPDDREGLLSVSVLPVEEVQKNPPSHVLQHMQTFRSTIMCVKGVKILREVVPVRLLDLYGVQARVFHPVDRLVK